MYTPEPLGCISVDAQYPTGSKPDELSMDCRQAKPVGDRRRLICNFTQQRAEKVALFGELGLLAGSLFPCELSRLAHECGLICDFWCRRLLIEGGCSLTYCASVPVLLWWTQWRY